MDEQLEIENGKYTIINNNGIVRVLRYSKEWDYDVDKFTLCLIQTIEQQQNDRKLTDEAFYELSKIISKQEKEIEHLKEELVKEKKLKEYYRITR